LATINQLISGDVTMNILIKGRVERRRNQFHLIKKKTKQSGLVAKWKVIDGQLVCQWHKA